jgi:pimeloyl-ACP methyl ester carboxylesterase
MNDRHWTTPTHDYAAALAQDLGYTPVHLHYNSGLHISTNGRAFARLLNQLAANWPGPLDELAILAHSMGGLVARSACHIAGQEQHAWLPRLRQMVFLGTPHHGAPLERGGNWLHAGLGIHPFTAPFARLGKVRSAGITDMRYGSLMDEDWKNLDRFARSPDNRRPAPLPAGVRCYSVAADIKHQSSGTLYTWIGDGLVPVSSALGVHPDPRLNLAFPEDRQWVGRPINHLGLLRETVVYERIRQWLAE